MDLSHGVSARNRSSHWRKRKSGPDKRFMRVAGLVINIQRKADRTNQDIAYPIIERSYLPASITGRRGTDSDDQPSLPEMPDLFGFQLNAGLFEDIRKHHIVLPRKIWLEINGSTQVQDLVYWLIFRCYSAASESIIRWSVLSDQFPQDKNPRRTVWDVWHSAYGAINVRVSGFSSFWEDSLPFPWHYTDSIAGIPRTLHRHSAYTSLAFHVQTAGTPRTANKEV